jgi:hypothetical protein
MDHKRTLVLLVIVSIGFAFTIGFLGGYMTSQWYMGERLDRLLQGTESPRTPSGTVAEAPSDTPEEDASKVEGSDDASGAGAFARWSRRDVVYYRPRSDSLWNRSYPTIGEGEGTLRGHVYFDHYERPGETYSAPDQKLGVALLLDGGKRTPVSDIRSDGSFPISLPEGSYHFNGLLLYDEEPRFESELRERIFLSDRGSGRFVRGRSFDGASLDRFRELKQRAGVDTALASLDERASGMVEFQNQVELNVSQTPITLPPFHYRSPLNLTSLTDEQTVSDTSLFRVEWSPHPEAHHYQLTINRLEQDGNRTHYRNWARLYNLDDTTVSLK